MNVVLSAWDTHRLSACTGTINGYLAGIQTTSGQTHTDPCRTITVFAMRRVLIRFCDRALLNWLSWAGFTLLVVVIAGCTQGTDTPAERTVQPSKLVPFDHLFALADTVVLDPSVLVGQIWFIDADVSGHMLITDISSGLVHLFEPTGQHISTFDKDVCYPNDSGHFTWTARFADNGSVIVTTMEGAVVIFDRSGNCLEARSNLTSPLQSFCTWGDSIFTFLGLRGPERKTMIEVHSMDLTFQRAIELATPEFPRLNSNYLGSRGRNMDCFRGGPLYKHSEDMDATPVSDREPWTWFRPEFFIKRDKDIPDSPNMMERLAARREFPLLNGLYALNEDIRLMVFSEIEESYRPEGGSGRVVSGFSIVSNDNRFEAVSTVPPKVPYTARHGHLYFVGPNVSTPDGDVGNQAVIRYRFKIPEAVDV